PFGRNRPSGRTCWQKKGVRKRFPDRSAIGRRCRGLSAMAAGAKDERPHIAVVEDEAFQRQTLVEYLGRNGFRVTGLDGGPALRRLLEREQPAVVLLDVGLSGSEDGFSLARLLRERSTRIGIIMVTAANDTVDRVVGLETGADDYVPKPFEPRELLAR